MSAIDDHLFFVGIGSSAGGLEALQRVVRALKPHYPFCFIVAQHLSPTHISKLTELLARETPLLVTEIIDGQTPEAGTIYITPPNCDVEIENGTLRVHPPQFAIGPKPSVDRLLTSLAEQVGERAIGIILSGTGGDGARGLAAIKAAGGLTLVQEPSSAKYTGMPNAALQGCRVDFVIVPDQIGAVLDAHLRGETYRSNTPDESDTPKELLAIVETVNELAGLDLSGYKASTLTRRAQRRLALVGCKSLAAYVEYLRADTEEAANFAREVLISVTGFFRDRHAFEALGLAIQNYLELHGGGREFRVWNAACATGEESYSLAILIEEAALRLRRPIRYKIFATDIDVRAIAIARQGIYSRAACEAMSEEFRQTYFENEGSELRAIKRLRNNIVFSVHNLVQDPPFSRIDMISCRNLLIYFNNSLQKRTLEHFCYSLNPMGMLFLGRSESIELHKDIFVSLDKDARIFRTKDGVQAVRPRVVSLPTPIRYVELGRAKKRTDLPTLETSICQFALETYAPSAVAINEQDEVVYILGNVEPFVSMRAGPAGLNVFDLVHDRFRIELRALVYQCRREHKPTFGTRHQVTVGEAEVTMLIAVRPATLKSDDIAGMPLLVAFERASGLPSGARPAEVDGHSEATEQDTRRVVDLEQELTATQEHLRTVIEELETSNEELQSLTEELQSANEELQATNEELQTANEELQSTNEELLTVNDELESKSRELEHTLTDLQNILASTEYPLIVVDKQLSVTRHVAAFEQLIEKDASFQCGDNIAALPWKLPLNDLRGTLRRVIDKGVTHQEILKCGKRYYRFVATPYRLDDREIAGAVLWFPDITDLTLAHAELAKNANRLRAIFESVLVGIITIDSRGIIQEFNRAAEQMFGCSSGDMVGQPVETIMPSDHAKHHRGYMRNYLKTGDTGEQPVIGVVRELEAQRRDGTVFPIELSVTELDAGGTRLFCGVINDISRRRQAEMLLKQEQARALVTLESINDAVITVDEDQCVLYLNPIAEELTGFYNRTAVNRPISDVYKIFEEKGQMPLDERIVSQLRNGDREGLQDGIILRNADGTEYSIEQSVAPLIDGDGRVTGGVVSFHDVTHKRSLLQQMTWQAQHDPLTGLVNRNEFERRLAHSLASSKSFDRQHALLFLDLDQFKLVNDTCGHHAGDQLLRQLASLLGTSLRHRDTLARMGGDEFAVLLENCSLAQGEHIAEKLHELVQEFRFSFDEKVFRIGVSIGVVPIDSTTEDIATLLSDADAACYSAKDRGRNRVQVHSPNDQELAYKRREMHWVARINQAIDQDRLRLYFQPIRSLRGGECVRWEVLLRIIDESEELVLPGVFLPAAERYGLIQNLDRWVLTTLLRELERCSGPVRPIVSINLSGSSLVNQKFFEFAAELVKRHIHLAEQLCFEITETVAITNFSAAQEFMRAMKRLGCLFALDDFGSGMSSFGYLKNLPVDYLKIDGVFVKDILHDEIDLFMVESIHRIGRIMNIKTIAEFAESEQLIEKLTQIGVDYAQGHGVGRPVALETFLASVESAH